MKRRESIKTGALAAGVVDTYRFETSTDGAAWTTNVASGRFGNIRNSPILQEVTFAPVSARFFRFTALQKINGNASTSAGEICLLPALMPQWPTGSVKGLRARGGFEVDMAWRDGKLTEAVLHSANGGSTKLRNGSLTREVKLSKGETYRWNGQ